MLLAVFGLQAAVKQLAAAAAGHPNLHVLALSYSAVNDSHLPSLLGQSSSWLWQQRACQHLQELRLAGNSALSGAAVAQLAKVVASGSGMAQLRILDLSQCPGVGDTGVCTKNCTRWPPEASAK
jgi:hypothetical protein